MGDRPRRRKRVVAYIVNRSFIDSRTFDGFRKSVAGEFSDVYVIDLGGDVRANPKLSGTKNNVFGIQTGVAILFLVRKPQPERARIFYTRRPKLDTAKDKLEYLRTTPFQQMPFDHVQPDKLHSWINQSESNWDAFLPVATKETKALKDGDKAQAIFKLYSLGAVSARDEWVYDFDKQHLTEKVKFFSQLFENEKIRWKQKGNGKPINDFVDRTIKWTSELEAALIKGSTLKFDRNKIRRALYRPYVLSNFYFDRVITHRTYQLPDVFGIEEIYSNVVIFFSGTNGVHWDVLASRYIIDYNIFYGGGQCLPLYRYDKAGNRLESITNWGLNQFRTHYAEESISRSDIFNYVYGVLHDPVYRKKYELNLRREFPRIPFYDDFAQWAVWGERLLKLHLDFETLEPYPLQRTDDRRESRLQSRDLPNIKSPKAKLRADKAAGEIVLDTETTLSGVPAAA
jgi:predicted helicase